MRQRIANSMGAALIILSGAITPVCVAADTVAIDISRIGRRIMHDGFLMEWSDRTARPWGSDTTWLWDAAATPEGFAGYLRTRSVPRCSGWEIAFSGSILDRPCVVRLPMDSTGRSDLLIFDRATYDSSGMYTIEWMFPLPKECMEQHRPFSLVLKGRCLAGDSLPTVVIKGLYGDKKANTMGSLVGRAVLIGILASLYFMVQRKIKRQSLQREPPRQPV